MEKRYVTNDTPNVLYVGGKAIPPGEGREVDALYAPDGPSAPAEKPAPEPTLADLVAAELKKPVAELVPTLQGLTADALATMDTLERAAKTPRKSLLAAIGEENLRRADAKLGGGDTPPAGDQKPAGEGEGA